MIQPLPPSHEEAVKTFGAEAGTLAVLVVPVPFDQIPDRILLLRGRKVMLSSDLAELYRVETRALPQAVKRNLDRSPGDFMFQLTWEEAAGFHSSPHKRLSRSQMVILKRAQNPQ